MKLAPLLNALSALKGAGAREIPTVDEVVKAQNGKAWYGEKRDGGHWKLQKHGIESYNVVC